ncbi:MAG: DUF6079 family protein, partial [Caldisericota bacterium]|nr:DUF6079 family protein [Caldisericota bacterium]
KSSDYAAKIARAEYEVNEGIKYWNGAFLTESEKERYKSEISALKGFMESLQIFNTPAKLQNFKYSVEEVNDHKEKLKKLYKLNIMKDKIKEINEIVLYLKHAQTNMTDDTELVIQVDDTLNNILDDIRKDKDISDSINALKKLKSKYIDMYINMHNRVRLNASEDDKKQKLLYDKRINALRQLKEIDILPGNKCDEFIDKITRMKTCWNLTKEKLERFPICPDCNFRPKEEKIVKSFNLEEMEEELDNLLETWTGTLINTFNDPKIKSNIELLTKEQKVMISTLIKNKKFELPIDIGLVEAIKELLHGIEKIEITIDELKNVMGNGNPLTLNDIKERFDSFINNKMSSMDVHNTRFVLKQKTDG